MWGLATNELIALSRSVDATLPSEPYILVSVCRDLSKGQCNDLLGTLSQDSYHVGTGQLPFCVKWRHAQRNVPSIRLIDMLIIVGATAKQRLDHNA
jgi:hypothetical protein